MNTKDNDTDKKQSEQDDKGFSVHDKRRVGKEEPAGAPEKEDGQAATAGTSAPGSESARPEGPGGEAEKPQSTPADSGTASAPGGEKREDRHGGGERGYMPLTFTSFVMSLSTSALVFLGQVPDPVSGKTVTDLTGARQMIDLISLLKEKTAGNLTPDEAAFVDTILYDLRMLFVKANT